MSKEWIDYYAILEVDYNATDEEIKKQHRNLLKKYHPDIYKGDDAQEKTLLINEAYDILGNPEKRAKYDVEREKRSNEDYVPQDENVDYDEVINNYNQKEQEYARKMAVKKVIKEKLAEVPSIIEAKNNLILSAYSGKFEKKEYRDLITEWQNIAKDFIDNLTELIEIAYEYDLMDEEEEINQAISEITKEITNTPLTISEVIEFIEDELIKDEVKKQIEYDFHEINALLKKFGTLNNQCYLNFVDKKHYEGIYFDLISEAEIALNKLKKIATLTKLFGIEEEHKKCSELILNINSFLAHPNQTYEEAYILGEIEYLKIEVLNICNKVDLYLVKLNKILKIMKKHPENYRALNLVNYSNTLTSEISNDIQEILCDENIKIKGNYEMENALIDICASAFDLVNHSDNLHAQAKEATYSLNYLKENCHLLGFEKIMMRLHKNLKEVKALYEKEELVSLLEHADLLTFKYKNVKQGTLIEDVKMLSDKLQNAEEINEYIRNFFDECEKNLIYLKSLLRQDSTAEYVAIAMSCTMFIISVLDLFNLDPSVNVIVGGFGGIATFTLGKEILNNYKENKKVKPKVKKLEENRKLHYH